MMDGVEASVIHIKFMRKKIRRKSHDSTFVDAFRTEKCGSSSGQVEESDHGYILNREILLTND